MSNEILDEKFHFIISLLHDFKQTTPFELIFDIPVLVLSLYASFDFKVYQQYFKYPNFIKYYHYVSLSFFLSNFYEYFGNVNKDGKIEEFTFIPLIFASGVIILIVYVINTIFEGRKVQLGENIPIEGDSNMTIKWNTPNNVFWWKVAISLELLTMLFYSPYSINSETRNRFLIEPYIYYTINVIILSANYLCLFRWKWMQFEWLTNGFKLTEEDSNTIRFHKVQVSFYMAIYPASKRFSGEVCSICLDLGPTAHFCSYHCFHESCLIPFLVGKTKIILNESYVKSVHRKVIQNGVRQPLRDFMTFEVKVKRENLPLCPNCKQHFDQNIVEIKMEDLLRKQMVLASVEIID